MAYSNQHSLLWNPTNSMSCAVSSGGKCNCRKHLLQIGVNMRGSSLVEFLCAIAFFLTLVLSGYKALDAEMQISKMMINRTQPEKESNYRLLAFKAFFESAASRFKKSTVLSEMPYFFSG